MIAGARAFSGDTPTRLAAAILERDPAPIENCQPHTPPALARLIAKCLHKDREARWDSARDLADELRWIGTSGASAGKQRQGRLRTAGGIVAAAAALAAVGFGLWWWLDPAAGLPDAKPRQVTAGTGWEADVRISPDGSDIVYAAEGPDGNVDLWLVDVRGGNPIRLTNDPAIDRSPAWYPDGSSIAFTSERSDPPGVWKTPRLGGAATMVVGAAEAPAISPDGTRIAFTRSDARGLRRIAVAPLSDTGAARVLTTDRDGLWDHRTPAWSPDGRTICYSGQRDLWVVPAAGGPAARFTTDDQYDSTPVFSPRSGFLFFSSYREGTNAIWRVAQTGGRPVRVTLGVGPEVQPSLSLDGTRLVYSTFSTNSDLVIVDRATRAEHALGGERNEVSPALAPDGSALAFASDRLEGRYDLWLQALDPLGQPAGEAVRLTDHAGAVTHPRFSPDGTRIVYQRAVEGQRDIWIVPRGGGAPVRYTDDPGADTLPEWSPDGRHIAFVSERSGAAQVWVAPAPGTPAAGGARQLTSDSPAPLAPTWSPDGRTIAYVGGTPAGGGDIWIADASGTAPPRQLTHGAMAHRAAWAGTGALLVSGTWKSGRLHLMRVDAATGAMEDAGYPGIFGLHSQRGEFVLSSDGRLLAAVRQRARGDIWLLEAVTGRY
jgi:Tol biopolymer transport system component